MKKNKKKLIGILTASLLALYYFSIDYEYHPYYIINGSSDLAFGSYSKGKVYIGDKYYIDSIKDNIKEDDILIKVGLDSDSDYSATIYSSYKINDKELRNEILTILTIYESMYPSKWDRSIESMRVEWLVHNILYNLNYEIDRTKDVDLDNSEEDLYDSEILRRLLKL